MLGHAAVGVGRPRGGLGRAHHEHERGVRRHERRGLAPEDGAQQGAEHGQLADASGPAADELPVQAEAQEQGDRRVSDDQGPGRGDRDGTDVGYVC